jgi:hypothetical protein
LKTETEPEWKFRQNGNQLGARAERRTPGGFFAAGNDL